MEDAVQIGNPCSNNLTYADKRRMQNAFVRCILVIHVLIRPEWPANVPFQLGFPLLWAFALPSAQLA